jgi:hypothetical protein
LKKKYLILLFVTQIIFSQAPTIAWQKCLGGTGYEYAQSIQHTSDGGYIIAGSTTESNNGDVAGNHGFYDGWVVKTSSTGTLEWQKCLGGVFDYVLHAIYQTSDGGYVVLGNTTSSNINISGNDGDGDFLIVKLSSLGEIEWQKVFGGTSNEIGLSIDQTYDGGYIVAGQTNSNNGNVTGNHGNTDVWIFKLSDSGTLLWQKCLGGTSNETAVAIRQTADHGFIVTGNTNSNDGNVTGNHGLNDVWVLKLSESGNLDWQKTLGGTDYDYGYSIEETAEGGYIVAGSTKSIDGNVIGNHGGTDAWVVKLSNVGTLIWQKALGGSGGENAYQVHQTAQGDYIVAGYTNSTGGDVSENHGGSDAWFLKLSTIGTLIWQKTLGGSSNEIIYSCAEAPDGGFCLAGYTQSNDGDAFGNHGSNDVWIVELNPEQLSITTNSNCPIALFPNPVGSILSLENKTCTDFTKISVTDLMGNTVLEPLRSSAQIDVESLTKGVYFLQIYTENERYTYKFVKR